MIGRLDRHVLSTYVVSALVAGGAFFCLFVLVDCFQHFEGFMRAAHETGHSLARVIVDYYLHQLPLMGYFLAPVVASTASVGALTKFLRENEMTVLKASGVSLYRACLPMLAGSALLGIAMAADQELLIPRVAASIRESEKTTQRRRQDVEIWDIFRVDRYRRAFQIQKYNRRDHRMENVTITQVDGNGLKRRVIYAARAEWDVDAQGAPQVVLSNGVDYAYPEHDPFGAAQREFGERGLRLTTSLSEAALLERDPNPLLLNSRELESHLAATPPDRRTEIGGRLLTALHARLPECLAPLFLSLLAIPLVLGQETRNYAWGLALGLSAWAVWFVLSELCRQLGGRWLLEPQVAAWLPALAAVPGMVMYLRIRT